MDASRFDALARFFGASAARRAAVRALVAGAIGTAAGAAGVADAKKKNKKKRKRCRGGTRRCGGRCVATGTDRANCGACGNACPDEQDCCDGACVDTESDRFHCGGCAPCPTGQSCVAGSCGLGPGTCLAAADDKCLPTGAPNCNNGLGCDCVTRFAAADLVCGLIAQCSVCDEDADCSGVGAGAFCARKTGPSCCTNLDEGQGFCALPCGG